jgi:hypothetical protein
MDIVEKRKISFPCRASNPEFTSGETAPSINWIGWWVGVRAGLDAVMEKKSLFLRRKSNPVRAVRRYTD